MAEILRLKLTAIPVVAAAMLVGCGEVPRESELRTAGVRAEAAAGGSSPLKVGNSAAGNYLAGRLAHKLGDYGQAGQFLNDALKTDPSNQSLLRRSYMVSIANGRQSEAVKLAAKLVAMDTNAPLAAITLAVEDIRNGKFETAQRRLETQKPRGFNRYIVPLILSWSLAGQQKHEDALKAIAPLKGYKGLTAIYNLHVGLLNDFAGRSGAAEAAYLEINKESDRLSLRVVQALGSLYERTHRSELAKNLYIRYHKENPDSMVLEPAIGRVKSGKQAPRLVTTPGHGVAESFFNLSGSLTQENSAQLALIFGRMAMILRPDFPLAQLLVGGILEALGRQKQAIATYDSIPSDAPVKWTARLRKAASLNALGNENEAIGQLQRMAAEQKSRTDALIDLGDILRAGKRFSESVAAYDSALDRLGTVDKRHWAILYSRGISLERSKQWTRAEKDFVRALKLNPEQPYVLNYLGYTWVDQGVNLIKARKMIERAVELRPNDGYIVDSLGWALYRMKDYGGAVKSLERAVELRPQDPTINDHLGDAYWRVGRYVEARFQWRRALTLEPEQETVGPIKKKISAGLANDKTAGGG